MLGVNCDARLLDLSHSLPPQNIRHAAYFLAKSVYDEWHNTAIPLPGKVANAISAAASGALTNANSYTDRDSKRGRQSASFWF